MSAEELPDEIGSEDWDACRAPEGWTAGDPLAPAAGVVWGILASLVIWALIGLVMWMVLR